MTADLLHSAITLPVIDAQISLVPASDRFIPIILEAVANIGSFDGLGVDVDAVSSHLSGRVDIVFSAIESIFSRAAASGAHIVLPILAAARPGESLEARAAPAVAPTGLATATQFSLLGLDADRQAELLAEATRLLAARQASLKPKTLAIRADGDAGLIFSAYADILTMASLKDMRATLSITAVANIPAAEAYA
jgi:hypothetical protein